jgi:7,8-dihydropterin-6-yl-methyl-4-(beta-D-ribofuranosyl)aminobenzene 5'-phosphate synthase
MREDLSLYVGGKDAFAVRWVKDKRIEKQDDEPAVVCWGALTRVSLLAHEIEPVCSATPHALDGAFTTGYIERSSFENTTSHTMIESPDHFTEAKRQGKLVTDNHPEEHALCYIVQGRGLVVISSCGHIGIV